MTTTDEIITARNEALSALFNLYDVVAVAEVTDDDDLGSVDAELENTQVLLLAGDCRAELEKWIAHAENAGFGRKTSLAS